MAEKSFGVKDINLVGATGTPTLESNGDLNITAGHVAIQTNTTISGVATVSNKLEIRVDDGTPARIDYYCEVSDSHYTRLQSAAHADYSGNVEVTLPVTSGKIIVGNSTSSIDNNINTTGIITAGTLDVSGTSTFAGNVDLGNNDLLRLGTSGLSIWWNNYANIQNNTGRLDINSYGPNENLNLSAYGTSGFLGVRVEGSTGESQLYHTGDRKLNTTGYGVSITGVCTATSFSGDGSALTNVSASVPANLTATTLNVSGVTTAANFRTNSTTGDGSDVGFAIKYYVTANGSSHYRFAGPGLLNTTDDPTIIVHRGLTYIFENSTGGSHPFRIQFTGTTIGVGTYLSGSQTGTQVFTIPMDAPATYEYQCTFHSGMKGTLHVTY